MEPHRRRDAAQLQREPAVGTVTPQLPAGFSATPASAPYSGLAPGATSKVSFTVTNTDAVAADVQPGRHGRRLQLPIVTTARSGDEHDQTGARAGPATTIHQAPAAPTVDGTGSPGEYAGKRLDIAGSGRARRARTRPTARRPVRSTRFGDDLYVAVEVTDDVLGTKLDQSDCKRHWRTDSVEIAIDPRGRAENTSTTFKTGILPSTAEGGPCFERDADNHQGPARRPPGDGRSRATVSSPYTGYMVEMKIPLADLPVGDRPAAPGAERLRLRLRHAGQDRPDPYRLVHLRWRPGRPVPLGCRDDTGLDSAGRADQGAGHPDRRSAQRELAADHRAVGAQRGADRRWSRGRGRPSAVATGAFRQTSSVRVRVDIDGPGEAHVFVVGPAGKVRASTVADLAPGTTSLQVPVKFVPVGSRVLMAYAAAAGGTTSSGVPVQ